MKRYGTVLVLLFLIALPVLAQSGQQAGQIIRADYGSGNNWVDVTQRVRALIRGDSLNFRVSNDTFGVDPRPGKAKVLRLQIQDTRGRTRKLTFKENQHLSLQVLGGGPYVSARSGRLQVNRAQYGAAGRFMDVTARLNSQIQGDQLSLQVTNENMGGDPAVGKDKTLTVRYAYNGQADQVVVREGDYLKLSGDAWPGSAGSRGYTTIPSGTQLAIRTNEVIDSNTATAGQKFSAVMEADVRDGSGAVAIPKGSDVELVIRSTTGSDLVLDIDSVIARGQRYFVSTGDLEQQGGQGIGANRRTAVMVGGGAALGALIGAIVGGGKGAAIGAGVGAAGGVVGQVLTKGKEVRVPAETVMNFRLDADLFLEPARW